MRMRFMAVIVAIAFVAVPAFAQTGQGQSIVIYGLGAGIDGTVGIGPIEAEVNVGFSDILSNLEFGAMGAYRNDMGRWSWGGEVIFMTLGNTDTGAEIDIDQLVLAGNVGYELNERLELVGGARYMGIDSTVKVVPPSGVPRSAVVSESWVDPFAGVRLTMPLGARSSLVLSGTVGGFGVGSDLSVDAVGFVELGLSDRTSVLLGYRALDVDYEDGSGADYFKYDTLTQGPAAGVRIRF